MSQRQYTPIERDLDRYAYLECRSRLLGGHDWERHWRPEGVDAPRVEGWHFWARCTSCSTVRIQVFSGTTGKCTYTRYIYPDGYSTAGEELALADFRKAALRKWRSRFEYHSAS